MLINQPRDPSSPASAQQKPGVGRPRRARVVSTLPHTALFKPAGIPARMLERAVLTVDEFEALRLVDGDGLSHDEAGAVIGVSRQTIGRMVESGRRTLIGAISGGHAIMIEGGTYTVDPETCAARRKLCRGDRGQGRRGPGCCRQQREGDTSHE